MLFVVIILSAIIVYAFYKSDARNAKLASKNAVIANDNLEASKLNTATTLLALRALTHRLGAKEAATLYLEEVESAADINDDPANEILSNIYQEAGLDITKTSNNKKSRQMVLEELERFCLKISK